MADTVTVWRKVAVTRKYFKIKHLRFVSKMLMLFVFDLQIIPLNNYL